MNMNVTTQPKDVHSESFWTSLSELQKSDLMTDVTIKCCGENFHVHKLVLISVSPFFSNMLSQETKGNTIKEIHTNGLEAHSVRTMIDFIYGRLDTLPEDAKELQNLLVTSHRLNVGPLVEPCIDSLLKKISETYFLEIWNTFERCEAASAVTKVAQKLAVSIAKVRLSDDFLQLTAIQLKSIYAAAVHGAADEVVQSILRWVNHDIDERQAFLSELFTCVNLNSVSANYLSSILTNEELVKKSSDVLAMVLAVVVSKMGNRR